MSFSYLQQQEDVLAICMGTETSVIPITREVFGPDGDKVYCGAIETFGHTEVQQGWCLSTGDEIFIHPSLIKRRWGKMEPLYWFRLSLEDGQVCLRRCPPWAPRDLIEGGDVFMAPPLQTATMSLDTFLAIQRVIDQQEGRCAAKEACTGSKRRRLQIRRSVTVVRQMRSESTFCAHCFDRGRAKKLTEGSRHVIIYDGRLIPVNAPIQILKEIPQPTQG